MMMREMPQESIDMLIDGAIGMKDEVKQLKREGKSSIEIRDHLFEVMMRPMVEAEDPRKKKTIDQRIKETITTPH